MRRQRFLSHAAPMLALAVVSLGAGVTVGALHVPAETKVADRFVAAWRRGDYVAMYSLIPDELKRTLSVVDFSHVYRDADATATAFPAGLRLGKVGKLDGSTIRVPATVRTRIFGLVREPVTLRFTQSGGDTRIDWKPNLAFPGLAEGERLSRRTRLASRAALLARDGTPLAQGPARTSTLGPGATQIVGEVGPITDDQRDHLRAIGVPEDATVGTSGLERALQDRLAGKPGGELLAGARVIARSAPTPGDNVRTTIDPGLENAAVTALGSQYGGVALINPANGEVLALAGVAYSALQPPGSTFKIITTTGALEAKIVKLDDQFPVVSRALLSGVPLQNANGEFCGGSFERSFAESCNSVFAPLGAKLGKRRLVAEAEKFGFNEAPSIDGAAQPSLPKADELGDDLDVGSTAIGQGKVQATALTMASVAATIGNLGRRVPPTLEKGHRNAPVRVTTLAIARLVRRLMVGVVRGGTGTAAQIPGVVVAGKTGTAELGNAPGGEQIPGDTDAWFAAFAPAKHPRFAIGVLAVRAGAGGAVAAPIARQVLAAALAAKPG